MEVQADNRFFLSISAFISDDELWMLTEMTDVLLCFDVSTMRLKKYFIIPGDEWKPYAHMIICKGSNGIYVLPYLADCIYRISKFDRIEKVPIRCENFYQNTGKFLIYGVWNKSLAFLGHGVRELYFFDENLSMVEKQMDYVDTIQKAGYDVSNPLFSDSFYQFENFLYAPVYKTNAILRIDLENKTHTLFQVGSPKKYRLRSIYAFGNKTGHNLLLTTCDDERLIWSPNAGVKDYKKLNALDENRYTAFGNLREYIRAYQVRGKRYYLPAWERKVFVEKEKNIFELNFDYELEGAAIEFGNVQFQVIFRSGDDIYFQARSNGQLFRIDTDSDIVERVEFNIDYKEQNKILNEVCKVRKKRGAIQEVCATDLDMFLSIKGNNERNDLFVSQGDDFRCGRGADRWRFLLHD